MKHPAEQDIVDVMNSEGEERERHLLRFELRQHIMRRIFCPCSCGKVLDIDRSWLIEAVVDGKLYSAAVCDLDCKSLANLSGRQWRARNTSGRVHQTAGFELPQE